MPSLTLIRLNSLRTAGLHFERDVATPVPVEIARRFEHDDRFRVNWNASASPAAIAAATGDTAEDNELGQELQSVADGAKLQTGTAPETPAERVKAVLEAGNALDLDDEEAFGPTGLPTLAALARALGWEPTADELAAAFPPPPATTKEAADAEKARPALKIKKGTAKPAAAPKTSEPLDTGAGRAAEGSEEVAI